MKQNDTYGEPKTIEFPNAVVKVYSPILTEEERKRRMERIAKSAERLITSSTVKDGPPSPKGNA